jgi:2-polyprenyl-6-methoxyphenol hydroxylase-like FAD-dependent oxidoreductase
MVHRKVNPRPGLALIGDAATTSDPVPAVGCGWAFRSAEWLAESTIPALRGEESLRTGLKRYARSFRFIVGHDRLIRSEARGREANPIQRALRTAARHDEVVASRLGNFAMRAIPVSGLLNPAVIGRALVGARRGDRSQGFVTVGMRQQAERH